MDVTDTETTYRRILRPEHLTVRHYPDAAHSLVKDDVERSGTELTLTAVLPRALFAEGFLDDQERVLRELDTGLAQGR
ncbi:hypothetical protein [Streptomyces sp. NPDC059176]|uniref:hypothetical protein n=1 Tax=unclassified Streptomyces TaxID=2593676 RepID=UPI0036881E35